VKGRGGQKPNEGLSGWLSKIKISYTLLPALSGVGGSHLVCLTYKDPSRPNGGLFIQQKIAG